MINNSLRFHLNILYLEILLDYMSGDYLLVLQMIMNC